MIEGVSTDTGKWLDMKGQDITLSASYKIGMAMVGEPMVDESKENELKFIHAIPGHVNNTLRLPLAWDVEQLVPWVV